MNKLLIATHNKAKFNDIVRFLDDIPCQKVSLSDLDITQDVKENGKTFEENAIKKAVFYAKLSGLPTLGDDSGVEIDVLSGKPGVKSKRWAGDESDEAIIKHTLKKLEGVPLEKRGAQFRVVIAYARPKGLVKTAEGITRGIIADHEYSGTLTKGFPYNQLVYIPELKKFYHDDELSEDELYRFNHRRIALEILKKYL